MTKKILGLMAFVAAFMGNTVAFAQESVTKAGFDASSLFVPIVAIVSVLAIVIAIGLWMRNYIKVPPNKVAVISGRKHKLTVTDEKGQTRVETIGSRFVSGGATFKWPVLERVDYLDLGVMNIESTTENAITKEGVPLTVQAVANVKIGGDDVSQRNAAERFLGKTPSEIHDIISKTLDAHLRAICGTLTVEQVNNDRATFAQKMITEAAEDLKKMGIVIDVWAVQHIQDSQGYLASLGKARTAQVQRDAEIGKAEAKRDQDIKTAEATREATIKATEAQRLGEVAKNQNLAQIAEAERDMKMKKADYDAQIAVQEAKRDQAGPKAHAEAEKDVLVAQVAAQEAKVVAETELQKKVAAKTEEELKATVLKQAEAAREKAKIDADAAKQKTVIEANAAKEKTVIEAEAAQKKAELEARAAVTRAEGQKQAAIAEGDGEGAKAKAKGVGEAEALKAKLLAEAEGEAAQLQQRLVAEAEGQKAKLLAEGEGQLKLAEALKAKLLAEAEGKKKMAEALAAMDEGARFMLLLQAAPPVIEAIGDAAAKALTPAFQSIGAGMANIDKVTIVDTGSGGENGGGIARFAKTAPTLFFEVMQQARALGVDPSDLFKKLGIKVIDTLGTEEPGSKAIAPVAPHAEGPGSAA